MLNQMILAVSLALTPSLQAKNTALVGTWEKDGVFYAELKADGSGTVEDQPITWSTLGRMLFLTHPDGATETLAFTLKGDSLQVLSDGKLTDFSRGKGGSKKSQASPKKKEQARDDSGQLAALLTSSPWCSFTYNKISGASKQERIVFRPNGTWGSGSRAESYSSGQYGSAAGQRDSAGGGRWEARGARLFLSEGSASLEDAGLSVTRNSNGYPILRSGKKEYSQCD